MIPCSLDSTTREIQLQLVSPRFSAWCAEGLRARPLHLGEEIAYFENERGAIAALASHATGPLPFGATLPAHDRLLPWLRRTHRRAIESIEVNRRGLFAPAFAARVEGAPTWNPNPAWSRLGSIDWTAARPPFVATADPPVSPPAVGLEEDWQQFLTTWPANAARTSAARLIGRGPGLTPTGDDRLAGFLLALWALDHPDRALAAELVDRLAPLTTRASAAWLRCAAAGEAALPWHRLVEALADAASTTASCRAILAWGSTSGRQMLVGFSDTISTYTRSPKRSAARELKSPLSRVRRRRFSPSGSAPTRRGPRHP